MKRSEAVCSFVFRLVCVHVPPGLRGKQHSHVLHYCFLSDVGFNSLLLNRMSEIKLKKKRKKR